MVAGHTVDTARPGSTLEKLPEAATAQASFEALRKSFDEGALQWKHEFYKELKGYATPSYVRCCTRSVHYEYRSFEYRRRGDGGIQGDVSCEIAVKKLERNVSVVEKQVETLHAWQKVPLRLMIR